EVLLSSDDNAIRVFRQNDSGWTELGPLSDPDGEPIQTSLARRVRPADLGRGLELVASGYFGNNCRYTRYRRDQDYTGPLHHGWRETDELRINARPDTPLYGMGNSTVDVADLDDDGDDDLLVGAEPGIPVFFRNVGTQQAPQFEGPFRLRHVDGRPIETHSIVMSPTVGSYWGASEWYSDRLAPRAVDWDGDGTLDMISGSMGRRLYFWKGVRVDDELRFEPPRLFRFGGKPLDLPDRLFPGVLRGHDGGPPSLILSNDAGHVLRYPGDGTLDLGEPRRLGDIVLRDFWGREKGNRSGFAVAPWTGPDRHDLVIFQFHRGVFLFPHLGGDRYGEEQPLVNLYSHLAGPTVVDYDRDGVLDLVVGGDERRMIEPSVPAHLVLFRGQDCHRPPHNADRKPGGGTD
ncbi:MAG: hypothetical protein AAF586_10675, partial [Planctomycetota bacterium]